LSINFDIAKARFGEKAKIYANDKEKTKELIDEAMKKASKEKGKNGPIDEAWEKIQLLFMLIKDWASGEYRDIPIGSIIAIIIAVLYFISPIDLIPDIIPGVGFADDIALIALVFKQINSDMEKYITWLEENR
jgi:uncharacterized membrane protein YkvA (DUF1232 family)